MGYFKNVMITLLNIDRILPKSKKGLVGMEVELNSGVKTTIKGWNYNRDSKIILSLTNGDVILIEQLPLAVLEKIESEL